MNTTDLTRSARLGVDIGRVIIQGDGPDTSFVGGSDEDALATPPLDGAFASLRRLTSRLDGAVWLVSKCGARVQARTRRWLDHHHFFDATGIARENLRFCRERHQKAPIARELGLDLFIDDRADILASMVGVVPHLLMFGSSVAPRVDITAVENWSRAEIAALAAIDEIEHPRRIKPIASR